MSATVPVDSNVDNNLSSYLIPLCTHSLVALSAAAITYVALKYRTTQSSSTSESDDPMEPAWFQHHAHNMIDWITTYRTRLYEPTSPYPVMSAVKPGYLLSALPAHPPAHGEPFSAIMSDVEHLILPGITHWQSPHFYAYFKNYASFPSFLADILSDAFSTVGFSWITSPAATELEQRVMDWLAQFFQLPENMHGRSGVGGGTICQTAGEATLIAMLAAKWRACDKVDEEERSVATTKLVAYISDQSHNVVARAAKVCGLQPSQLRTLKTTQANDYAMNVENVRAAIEADRANGLIPFFICLTVGTTAVNAIDDISTIAPVARDLGLWVHVDGAYGGVYAALPETQHHFHSWKNVDSININAHKGLFTHFDCALLFVSDRHSLISSLTLTPMSILYNVASDNGNVIDYKDWGISFGRRFRALKLWFVIRSFGTNGLCFLLKKSLINAELFEILIDKNEKTVAQFQLFSKKRVFGLVLFIIHPHQIDKHINNNNNKNKNKNLGQLLLDRCNASGRIFLTSCLIDGQYILRLATAGNETEEIIRNDWSFIEEEYTKLTKEL